MRKIAFAPGEKYHIYNRGTEKRKIFLDKNDYERFIFIMDFFNNVDRGFNVTRNFKNKYKNKKKIEKLVDIETYCLMPNHYHFLLEEKNDGGISKFLQKVMTGYAMYFNKKYKRTGSLFQGKPRSKHVDKNSYYMQLKAYIDLNPVEIFDKSWKDKHRVKSVPLTMKFLKEYKWSGCKNFNIYIKYLNGEYNLPTEEELFG